MSLSLSTSWNAFRYEDGEEIIEEIRQLGFDSVELSFNLTAAILDGMEKVFRSGGIKVSSVHNFCPIPDGLKREIALPECFSMSSPDERERALALTYSKRSIDTACRFAAKAVVLHSGKVSLPDHTRELIALYNCGQKDSPQFTLLREQVINERESQKVTFLNNTLRSLDELNRYAQDKGILLGIENRYYLREIPALEEIGLILDKFEGSNIFYWHDVGHARVLENLGFPAHDDYLRLYGGRLIGVHLHGVSGCSDHRVPVKGEFDPQVLEKYVTKDTLMVMEAHHPATFAAVKESKKYLESIFSC